MADLLVSLGVFAVVATATPGGATTLATASGAQFGYRRSLPLIAGIAVGLASVAALSSAWLAALLETSPGLRVALKLAGSFYLLWLAMQIGRSGPPGTVTAARPMGFWQGLLLLWLNPKAWAMTFGAGASFAALADGPVQLAAFFGLAFGMAALGSLSLWCAGGLMLARILRSERQWRIVNVALGLTLALSVVPLWLG